MKVLFTISAFCLYFISGAQSLSPVVISSGGTYTTMSAGSLSSTIGESIVTTATYSGIILTQGFQQAELHTASVNPISFTAGTVKMYPNPVSDMIHFDIQLNKQGTVRIELFDILGNKVMDVQNLSMNGSNYTASQDVTAMTNGVYIAKVSFTSSAGLQEFYMQKFTVNK